MKILKDTSLCAIVRDEKMNPAGGVERFLRCHLPYVEEAVVVDTGSVDGTREVLNQMTKEFTHLKVYKAVFRDYAQARNVSLEKVKTKWALVLDADELIESDSFDIINDYKKSYKRALGFNFEIRNLHSDEIDRRGASSIKEVHNPRLFDSERGFLYHNCMGRRTEWLFSGNYLVCESARVKAMPSPAHIIHFLPSLAERDLKSLYWYNNLQTKGAWRTGSPSKAKNFAKWKKLSPHRENYSG